MTTELVKLDQAKTFIAESTDLSELLDFKNKVDAGLLYAKRSNLHEAQNELAEVKLRIDRRLGQILTDKPKQHGARPADTTGLQTATPSTYKDIGIEKTEAHRLQQVASVPEEKFEAYVVDTQKAEKEITTADVLRLAKKENMAEPCIA